MNQCKFAYLWISGKRRHSGEMSGKSQLKADIFYLFLRHLPLSTALAGKKINKLCRENACGPGRLQNSARRNKKVDQMVKIYNNTTKNGGII
ncbi:hypothetical protein [Raoultella planticola]|uniref:hypothetical protein n=1 Tax=Raoultella planticola TaxID=575 RepID=UPI001D0CEC85|nr:hypothetical protein [Raoultella planticola]